MLRGITLALAWAAAILMAAAGAMLTYEVIARYFFTAPTIWAAELSQLCLIWGSLIAMAHIQATRRHIAVNAITSRLSGVSLKTVNIFSLLCILVFSIIVTIWGWDIFWDSFVRGRTTGSLLNLPIWIAELAVPFGFALLAVQCVHDLVWSGDAPQHADPVHE